jgi:hypothetical protein
VFFRACKPSAKRLAQVLAASLALVTTSFCLGGCSHAKKKIPELSELEGKKVALIEVDGEATARSITEVALINQLMKHGSFDIVSKQDVDAARTAPEQDPTDWRGIGRRAGADYALKAKILEFTSEEHEGYSSEEVEDSQLAAEMGESARKTQHLYKVKSLTGKVRVQLDFARTDVKDADLRSGVAESEDKVTAEAKTEAAHLPPRLRFLEKIENEAFRKFFEQYK